jgi:hypothetical protein
VKATPIGCAVNFSCTQGWSFSFTFQTDGCGAGLDTSARFIASSISARLRGELVSRTRCPFSGMKASRNTIAAIFFSTCSAAPEMIQPP